jgi:hypothetical protein
VNGYSPHASREQGTEKVVEETCRMLLGFSPKTSRDSFRAVRLQRYLLFNSMTSGSSLIVAVNPEVFSVLYFDGIGT